MNNRFEALTTMIMGCGGMEFHILEEPADSIFGVKG